MKVPTTWDSGKNEMNSEVMLRSSHGPALALGESRQLSSWPWELYQALGPRSWPYSQLEEKATSPRHIANSGTKSVGKKKSYSALSLLGRWQIGTRHIWVTRDGEETNSFRTIWRSLVWRTGRLWPSPGTHHGSHPLSGDLTLEMVL